jgi:hypothetical protein
VVEIIHSETYSLLIDTYIIDTSPKTPLNETTFRHLLAKTSVARCFYGFQIMTENITRKPTSSSLTPASKTPLNATTFDTIEQSLVFPD